MKKEQIIITILVAVSITSIISLLYKVSYNQWWYEKVLCINQLNDGIISNNSWQALVRYISWDLLCYSDEQWYFLQNNKQS